MGINIGICETDAKSALCRDLRMDVIRVRVDNVSGMEGLTGYDEVVSLADAKTLVDDWDAFLKRNRISEETDAVYMDKLKNDSDIDLMRSKAKKISTGWVDMDKVCAEDREKVLSASRRENRLTGWDMLSFDEMNEMCLKCTLSWDKGRGCIGSFGPDNSLLPEIAGRRGCEIVASVPEGARTGRIYTPDDARTLQKEISILNAALPEEGKMMVRRYSGPLERMGAVADISVKEGCGFYFF
ncbi:MAG: hypothetical protein LBU30_06085 [Candidatus Methanoplasma sp.]|jgi:hypothetical protein|nr:hypothetical protein [Candidatus Methanoplasma sp.]